MEELKLVVQQKAGTVAWNFEELKGKLQTAMDVYKSMVYTDDNVKDAKKDVAELRKLVKEVKEKSKEIKNKCLEPYLPIEAQAKELENIINEPINLICTSIDSYEQKRLADRKKAIRDHFDSLIAEDISFIKENTERIYSHIYDSKWENVTTSMKAYKDGLSQGLEIIRGDIATIQSFKSDFEEEMLSAYKEGFILNKAIVKMNELKEQAEKVIAREKERLEREAEEKAKREAAAKVIEAEQPQQPTVKTQTEEKTESIPEPPISPSQEPTAVKNDDIPAQETVTPTITHEPGSKLVRFYADEEKINEIIEYANFNGVKAVIVE